MLKGLEFKSDCLFFNFYYQEWKLVKNFCYDVRLAKLAVDKVSMAPCSTSILYPRSGGNVHRFTAITPCAVLTFLHLLTMNLLVEDVLTIVIILILASMSMEMRI